MSDLIERQKAIDEIEERNFAPTAEQRWKVRIRNDDR